MVTLSRTMIFWLSFSIFWAGVCFGAGFAIFFNQKKKNKKLELAVVLESGEATRERYSKEGLRSISGERNKEK